MTRDSSQSSVKPLRVFSSTIGGTRHLMYGSHMYFSNCGRFYFFKADDGTWSIGISGARPWRWLNIHGIPRTGWKTRREMVDTIDALLQQEPLDPSTV